MSTTRTAAPTAALASLSLSMLLSAMGTSIANVGLPSLAQAFNVPMAQVQWVVLAYLLAVTTLVVGVGRMGDVLGRRRLLLAGIAVFTAASLLCSAAPTLWLLLIARALQGLGAAAMMALTLAFVSETVAKEKTGRAMGLLGTMSAVGTALGPALGGFLVAGFGWQALFLVNVPLGLLAFALAWRSLPADRPHAPSARTGLDPVGTLLLALTLAAYALAMTLHTAAGAAGLGPLNGALLLATAVGVVLFVRVEAHASAPLVRLALFREPPLRASLAMAMLVSTVVMATLVVGPFYLTRALGLHAAQVGLVLSIGPCAAALAGVPAGRLVDHFGGPAMVVAGLLTMAAGTLLLGTAPLALGIAGYAVPITLLTMGYALFQTANNTATLAGVAADQRGVVSGMLSLSRNLGLITGASAMGTVFAAVVATQARAAQPAAAATGMRVTFLVCSTLVIAAVALAAPAWRRDRAAA